MPRWLLQVLGYLLSAACLGWVLYGYPLNDLIPTIRSLDWRWVGLGMIADLSVYVVHAWRWDTLLAPGEPPAPLAHGSIHLHRLVCQ